MLHWQLLKWLKGIQLGAKITILSFFAHTIILFCLLFIYKESSIYHVSITSTMINTDVPIVFLPLYKSLQSKGAKPGSVSKERNNKKNEAQSVVKKISNDKKNVSIQKKEKALTTISELTPVTKNKQGKKIIQKKTAVVQAASKLNKQLQKSEKKSPEVKKEDPIVLPVPKENTAASLIPNDDQSHQEKLYVGQLEMEALQIQEYIQQEIVQHWCPPPGIRKDIYCTIKVIVGLDGKVSKIDLERPSGVLLFDGAAQRAATKLNPPKWVYGKELSITFNP